MDVEAEIRVIRGRRGSDAVEVVEMEGGTGTS